MVALPGRVGRGTPRSNLPVYSYQALSGVTARAEQSRCTWYLTLLRGVFEPFYLESIRW